MMGIILILDRGASLPSGTRFIEFRLLSKLARHVILFFLARVGHREQTNCFIISIECFDMTLESPSLEKNDFGKSV